MKILAVCGLGQGSSLILRMTIEDVLKELSIRADVDHMDVSSANTEKADFIVTSPQLAPLLEGNPAKKVVVNNYFEKKEVRAALVEAMK